MTGLALPSALRPCRFLGEHNRKPHYALRWSRGVGRGRGHWGRNRHCPPDHGEPESKTSPAVTGQG